MRRSILAAAVFVAIGTAAAVLALPPGGGDVRAAERFSVLIHTGDQNGAGSKSNTWIEIGDTCYALSKKGHDKYEENKYSEFDLPGSVEYTDSCTVALWSDNDGDNSAWWPDTVELKSGGRTVATFQNSKWIGTHGDGGKRNAADTAPGCKSHGKHCGRCEVKTFYRLVLQAGGGRTGRGR